jgi:hypothetical protein
LDKGRESVRKPRLVLNLSKGRQQVGRARRIMVRPEKAPVIGQGYRVLQTDIVHKGIVKKRGTGVNV